MWKDPPPLLCKGLKAFSLDGYLLKFSFGNTIKGHYDEDHSQKSFLGNLALIRPALLQLSAFFSNIWRLLLIRSQMISLHEVIDILLCVYDRRFLWMRCNDGYMMYSCSRQSRTLVSLPFFIRTIFVLLMMTCHHSHISACRDPVWVPTQYEMHTWTKGSCWLVFMHKWYFTHFCTLFSGTLRGKKSLCWLTINQPSQTLIPTY